MTGSLGFVRFTATLTLESDLHIGDGGEAEREVGEGLMATVVRDAYGNPVIPGTALKGALRAAVRTSHREDKADELFGAIKASAESGGSTGHIGKITLYAARQCAKGEAPDLPSSERASTALATHVALGRKYGVAEEHKLYSREIVPAGAKFRLEGIARDVDSAEQDLKTALGPLRPGIYLGRGSTKDNGRISLVSSGIEIVRRRLNVCEDKPKVVESTAKLNIPDVEATKPIFCESFKLHCSGPFLSHDPARNSHVEGQDNVLFALRRDRERPVLWPESLYGVLRDRCAWLAAIDATGDGSRDREERSAPLPAHPACLGRTGRLFGVTGWRGLVRIEAFALSGGERLKTNDKDSGGMAGIAIDRFSGAVLDTGPYFTDAWVGLTLQFSLNLDRRGDFPSKNDRDLFCALAKYIRVEGLLLGHGVNRGFGWFDPVETEENAS